MSFLETIQSSWMSLFGTKPKALPENAPNARLLFQGNRHVGKTSVDMLRHWAEHSEWVRAAISIRKAQVAQSDWDIGPFDPDKPYSVRQADKLRRLFARPNPQDGDFRTFAERVLEDVLVLDAGCIEEVRGLGGETVELWPVDGGSVRVDRFWDGNPDAARYYWYPPMASQPVASWVSDDFLYIMQNPRTYSVIGLSPLETLKLTIDAELSGSLYNKRQVEGAAPDGIINLGEGIRPEKVDEFRAYWDSEVAGKGAIAFIGGSKSPSFIDFRKSNRDMQYQEWLNWLVRKIAAVYQLTPQDLGLAFDVNRSTSEVLAENSEDRGLRPLLGLIQSTFTREIVWDEAFGGPANNLAFMFTNLNMKESLSRAEFNKLALAGMPWKSINEARVEAGMEPLEGFDKLMANTSQGLVTLEDIMSARELVDSKAKGGQTDGPARPTPQS